MVTFSSAVNETEPLPLPLPPLLIASQLSLLEADHSQPSGVLTLKLPLEPSNPMKTVSGDRE